MKVIEFWNWIISDFFVSFVHSLSFSLVESKRLLLIWLQISAAFKSSDLLNYDEFVCVCCGKEKQFTRSQCIEYVDISICMASNRDTQKEIIRAPQRISFYKTKLHINMFVLQISALFPPDLMRIIAYIYLLFVCCLCSICARGLKIYRLNSILLYNKIPNLISFLSWSPVYNINIT